jgi:acetyl-CoA carboxylase biotin carboxyl carrier protein
MDLDQLRQILELVRDEKFAEFEVEQDGLRVRIRKDGGVVAHPVINPPVINPVIVPPVAGMAPSAVASSDGDDTEIELAVVKSPIVGTFYRAAEPGAPPFADIGTTVKKGQVLCIIEAMKLMNEIDSEYDGEIVNIYVENGQPVQYGERLFAIRTR